MILNNYWRLKHAIDTAIFRFANGWAIENIGLIDINGNSFNTVVSTNPSEYYYMVRNMQLKTDLIARVGSGIRDAALNDYALASDISANISNLNYSIATTYTNGQEVTTVTITGTNNTSSDITINEIGLMKAIYRDGVSTSYNYTMLCRSVLDDPITVAAGDGFTYTFLWEEGIQE
jgi:hypothetical protein